MTDPREDAAREWIDAGHREQWYEDDKCDKYGCDRPWSEHPAMLLAAIDATLPLTLPEVREWLRELDASRAKDQE